MGAGIDVPGKRRDAGERLLEGFGGCALLHLVAVGPLYKDSDKTEFGDRIGSMFIVDFPNRPRADEWRAQEPYTRNDVYDHCWGYAYENLWRGV